MSTLPPDQHRNTLMRTSSAAGTMAAPSAKPKAASAAKAANNGAAKSKSQMHRRSRTGCYTCRLRRKKCDEGNPMCTACRHLGLECEYKRPMWWSNNDHRRKHKDNIKMIIKRKKLSEKSAHSISTSVSSPPGLSHSLPTSATFTDPLDRNRSASIDSHFSTAFNFNSPPTEYGHFSGQMPHEFMFGTYSPYEIDVKTERQILFIFARRRAKNKASPSTSPSSGGPPSSGAAAAAAPSSLSHKRAFSSSSGPRGNMISEPIMQQNSYRTDFILKNPFAGTASSVASTPLHLRNSVHPHISTVRDYDEQNPFRSPAPSQRESVCSSNDDDDDRSHHRAHDNRPPSARSSRLAPIRGMRAPRTPKPQASYESINVFADPGTVDRHNRYSRGTTVSGLMIGLRGELEPERVPSRTGGSSNRLNVPGTTPRI